MIIDIESIKSIAKDKANRYKNWTDIPDLVSNLPKFYQGLKDWMENNISFKAYNIASIMISFYRLIEADKNNKKRFNPDKTKRSKPLDFEVREIVLADLGGTNYGVEASYEHPCVVLHNGYYFLVVIPCSTGRANKSDYILNANKLEGFNSETGVQIDQIRVIDKSRVIQKNLGKVPVDFMSKINDKVLEKYLKPLKDKMVAMEKEIVYLKSQLELERQEAALTKNEQTKQ